MGGAMAERAEARKRWHEVIDAAGWRALAASWLGWMFDGYETFTLVLVAVPALRQLLAPDQLPQMPIYIGGLLAATLLGWATGGVVAGVLTDYIGRKRMLMLTILWYAVFAGLTALSQSYWMFVGLRFLTGLGLGGEWGPGTAIVAEMWPPGARGRAAGVLNSAFGCGFLLASAVWVAVGPLGDHAWRYMFLLGILPALLVLYIRTGVQNPDLWVAADERRREARARRARGEAVADEDRALLRFTILQVLADPVLRRRLGLLLVMSLASVVGWWATSTWIPQYVGQIAASAGHSAADWAARTGLVYNLGAIAGYLTLGVLADAWGRKPTICLYYLGAWLMVVVVFLVVRDPGLLLVAAVANGFFTSGQFSWMPTYLPELFPTPVRGSAISMVFDSSRYVAAAGPLLAGWLAVTLGGVNTAAAILGLVYLAGLAVAPFAGPETRGQPLPE